MSSERVVLSVVYTSWLVLATIAQSVLLYFILRHSPKSFRMFRFLLADTSVFELLALFATYFTQLGLVTNEQPMLIRSYGFCRFCDAWVCLLVYIFTLVFVWLSITSIFCTFYFKYLSVVSVLISSTHMLKFIVFCHAPAVLYVALYVWFFLEISPSPVQLGTLRTLSSEESSAIGYLPDTALSFSVIYLMMSVSAVVVPPVCWFFRKRIVREVNLRAARMSNAKRAQHMTFVKGLSIQIIVPSCVYLPAFVIYYYCYLKEVALPLADLYTFAIAGIPPLVDPIVSLYFVTPFRKSIEQWINGGNSSRVIPVSKTI